MSGASSLSQKCIEHIVLLAVVVSLVLGAGGCEDGQLNLEVGLSDVSANATDVSDTATNPVDTSNRGDTFEGEDSGDLADADVPDAIGSSDTSAETGPVCLDLDGDGFGEGQSCLGRDCSEGNPAIFPGQTEACNGVDDSCDGVVDEGCHCDYDGSPNGVCANQTRDTNGLCEQPSDYESEEASCDGKDNDCDGQTDEGCTPTPCTNGDGVCPSGCARADDNDCPPDCRDPQGWSSNWASFEDEVLLLVNQERAAGATCGTTHYPTVPAVSADVQLREAARCHSLDMAVNDFFSHTGSNGSSAGDRITQTGYQYSYWAENISAGRPSAADVVDGWMNSTGHCKNIMSSNVTELGVGYVFDDPDAFHGYSYYWTQVFGRPR